MENHETDAKSSNEITNGMDPPLPKLLDPREKSYLLKGLVNQITISREIYELIIAIGVDSLSSKEFTAVRLPARKKNKRFHMIG